MKKVIRLGTRDSELALWQANFVRERLESGGMTCELIPVKSEGDLKLDLPLYELGVTGIFTRTLDIALLRGDIDIAVHSFKDVPTRLPAGIIQAAVLERANPRDLLVHRGLDFLNTEGTVATGSLRRRAQWLHRYPLHHTENIRGNVNTRLQKFVDSDWDGVIFAAAGLDRIEKRPASHTELQWMIPAPAQGAMVVVARDNEPDLLQNLRALNHEETAICTTMERDFLRELEGGCTAPIGALARLEGHHIHFRAILLALDGQKKIEIDETIPLDAHSGFGARCAREVLDRGGRALMAEIKSAMQDDE